MYFEIGSLFQKEMGMSGCLVVCDGVGGVGKSTIAREFAQRVGGTYFSFPPKKFADRQLAADEMDDHSRFLFDLAAIRETNRQVMLGVHHGLLMVVDRWMYSVLAYHFAMSEIDQGLVEELSFEIVEPDMVFCVHINDKGVLRQRLARRNVRMSKTDLLTFNDAALLDRVWEVLGSIVHKDTLFLENSGALERSVDHAVTVFERIAVEFGVAC